MVTGVVPASVVPYPLVSRMNMRHVEVLRLIGEMMFGCRTTFLYEVPVHRPVAPHGTGELAAAGDGPPVAALPRKGAGPLGGGPGR